MPVAYQAFISYSHGADKQLASQVQRALQRLAKPWYRRSAIRIFRDDTSLSANPGLWSSLEQNLSQSQYFILMASEDGAKSPWVAKEVQWWLEHRGIETLLIVVSDGKIRWDLKSGDFDWTVTTCLPPVLAGHCPEEPLFVDLRWAKAIRNLSLRDPAFRAAIVTLAAPLHGRPKDELDSEDIRQHRRVVLASVLAGLTITSLTLLSLYGLQSARRESAVARSNQLQAESRRLAAKSLEALDQKQNVGDAIPLAVLAWRLSPTREALDALRRLEQTSSDMARVLGKHTSSIQALAFSPGSASLATASDDGSILIWSIPSGTLVGPALAGERQFFQQLVFDASGSRLLVLGEVPEPRKRSDDGIRLTLWDLQTGTGQTISTEILFKNRYYKTLSKVDLALNGHRVAVSGSNNEMLALWDDGSGAFREVRVPSRSHVHAIQFLGETRLTILFENYDDHSWRIGRVDALGGPMKLGPPLVPRDYLENYYWHTFSPNGRRLVRWGADTSAPTLWDIKDDILIESPPLPEIPDEVSIPEDSHGSAGFDHSGKRLVVTGNGALVVWDLEKKKVLKAVRGNDSHGDLAALSPDGRWLAISDPRQLVVFDLNLAELATDSGRALNTSCDLDSDREVCIRQLCEKISERLNGERLQQLAGSFAYEYLNGKSASVCKNE